MCINAFLMKRQGISTGEMPVEEERRGWQGGDLRIQ